MLSHSVLGTERNMGTRIHTQIIRVVAIDGTCFPRGLAELWRRAVDQIGCETWLGRAEMRNLIVLINPLTSLNWCSVCLWSRILLLWCLIKILLGFFSDMKHVTQVHFVYILHKMFFLANLEIWGRCSYSS